MENDRVMKETLAMAFPKKQLPKFIKDKELKIKSSIYKRYDMKYGDSVLYQIVSSNGLMTYPKMGIFVGYGYVDMAITYQFIEKTRNNEFNYIINFNIENYSPLNSKIVEIVEWDDTIYIFGVWKHIPNWKEMKIAYKKTFYFRTSRIDKINYLIKNNGKNY